MMSNDPRRQPTRDHIDPVSKDGKDDPSNVHVTCVTCNGDKGNLTLVAWYFELHEAGDLRARHVAQFLKTWRPQQQAPEEALGR
jgi:hypothetical protein